MKEHYSLVIVGAGPAGMAAAIQASEFGIRAAVLDEQPSVGGQIYRAVDNPALADSKFLGQDYRYGRGLSQAFNAAKVDYFPGASVWNLENERKLSVLIDGVNYYINADQIIICTGAQERPVPVIGWELPGVMTVGAGQVLLKSAALVPSADVVLAGSGPLLLLLVWQYIRAGVKISAILDTTPKHNIRRALRFFPKALRAPEYLKKGLSMKKTVRQSGISLYKNVGKINVLGENCVRHVRFETNGVPVMVKASTLFLHAGIIPQTQLALVADCAVKWNNLQLCWQPVTDHWGTSSRPGIFIAGDSRAVMGARASQAHGQLCALKAAHELGRIDHVELERLAVSIRKELDHHLAIRPFLDVLYRPASWLSLPPDEVIVCRCEEITAGEIREIADLGCQGPNQAKCFSRCGMGPCQGRQCGPTVSTIIAARRNMSMQDVGYFRVRPPIKPIALGQL